MLLTGPASGEDTLTKRCREYGLFRAWSEDNESVITKNLA